jgi:hypothetical protein
MRAEKVQKGNDSTSIIRLRDPRSMKEGYMEYELEPKSGRDAGLAVSMKFTPEGQGRNARSASVSLPVDAASIATMRYSKSGSTGNVGYMNNGHGAGVLAVAGDRAKGVVLIDVEAAKLISGGEPTTKELRSLKELAQDPKIKAFAKAGGIDVSKLRVSIDQVNLSAGYRDKNLHALALDLTLTDGRVTQKGEFSALLRGDLSRGLGALTLSRFEAGVASSAGWLYRPSDMPGDRDVFVRG